MVQQVACADFYKEECWILSGYLYEFVYLLEPVFAFVYMCFTT